MTITAPSPDDFEMFLHDQEEVPEQEYEPEEEIEREEND